MNQTKKMDLNISSVSKNILTAQIKKPYRQILSKELLSLEILHHQFDEKILNELLNFCKNQGFFLERKKWLNGHFSLFMPTYILLRALESKAPEFQEVLEMRTQMKDIVYKIHNQEWLGFSKKPITDIVNIGIGGSDLGPKFCYDALKSFQKNKLLNFHFISDADYYTSKDCLEKLNRETTLFIVASKSFSTEETLLNAKIAIQWIDHPDALKKHFIAVTANPKKAQELGYQNILSIGSWIIGRYSSFSAINMINVIALGYENYMDFLDGAREIDMHFLSSSASENLPIMLALIGIWNINFLNIPSHLMLIYHSKIKYFCDYIQQLDMESNGKCFNQSGKNIEYLTGPIVWGGLGNSAQHSYYQLLSQGKHEIAIDFISVNDNKNHYLNQLCLKRKLSLHKGLESDNQKFSMHQRKSINHIELNSITPKSIGALIALYEHKIFTQAWLWNINPFDQPGVEQLKRSI